jgi:uncharacterized protein YggE
MPRKTIVTLALWILAIMPFSGLAAAQSEVSKARVIEVSGDGQAQSPPDQATVELAIETHAATAGEAAGSNGALAQKVRDALKNKLGDKGTMWTGGYSLYPDYSEPRPGSEAKIIGYHAQNTITVESADLELVGPVIDAAIGAGANRVNSLQYTLRDNTKARSEAISRASKDAQAQAQALATALGIKLGSVIKATTVAEVRPIPLMRLQAATAMAASAPTPVEAGQITVPATVSLTYEIQ